MTPQPLPGPCEEPEPATPALVLTLPETLSEAQTLCRLAEAIRELRGTLAGKQALFQRAADQADQAGDDPVRRALLRGQVKAYAEAAAHLDEQIVEAFDLSEQYDRWLQAALHAADTLPGEAAEQPQLP